MPLRTRIETRVETMVVGGKTVEFTYNVTVWLDTLPAPSQENPYCEGGRCLADARDAQAGNATPGPAPVTEKRRPTKAEYIRAFDAAGDWPACVAATVNRVVCELNDLVDHFGMTRDRMPGSLRKALARFDATLGGVYDVGALARIGWYFAWHKARTNRAVLRDRDQAFAGVF